tara:strand:- start:582 stop:806 length:225 start_codon:yes stop_codon:yes gene_type:complete
MRIDEMFDSSREGYETEEDDNTTLSLNDLRKTKLTLMQLNRLRIMDDVRTFEQERKKEEVHKQYKPAPEMPGSM